MASRTSRKKPVSGLVCLSPRPFTARTCAKWDRRKTLRGAREKLGLGCGELGSAVQ
jgi:hypothetical protein